MASGFLERVCRVFWLWRDINRTRETAVPIRLQQLFFQKVLGINRQAYWPVDFTSRVTSANRIRIGVGTAPGLSHGCYIQGGNGIEIGEYTLIAPGVGLISANHSPFDTTQHVPAEPIRIGKYCWIGMNAVILPGVCLGDHTVVGAGSVVTKSFPAGYCVIGGVPAAVLKHLDKAECGEPRNRHEYVGFHPLRGRTCEEVLDLIGIARF